MENEIPDGQKEIDALARRHQQLLEKLKAAPVVEVAGVVHASGGCGVGGIRTGEGEDWEFQFRLNRGRSQADQSIKVNLLFANRRAGRN